MRTVALLCLRALPVLGMRDGVDDGVVYSGGFGDDGGH